MQKAPLAKFEPRSLVKLLLKLLRMGDRQSIRQHGAFNGRLINPTADLSDDT